MPEPYYDGRLGKRTPRLHPSLEELNRILSHVEQNGSECWEWVAHKNDKGYGQVKLQNKLYWAHRLFFAIFAEEIPEGDTIDHTCRNPSCVNPAHLRLCSHSENTANGNRHRNEEKDDEVPF